MLADHVGIDAASLVSLDRFEQRVVNKVFATGTVDVAIQEIERKRMLFGLQMLNYMAIG